MATGRTPCRALLTDTISSSDRQELARQLLVRPLCDLVSPSEKRGRDRAGWEQAWGSGKVLGQRGEQVHRRHERRVQAHQTGLPPPGRHPHRPVLKPANCKNSGRGRSAWFLLVTLTDGGSHVHPVQQRGARGHVGAAGARRTSGAGWGVGRDADGEVPALNMVSLLRLAAPPAPPAPVFRSATPEAAVDVAALEREAQHAASISSVRQVRVSVMVWSPGRRVGMPAASARRAV